MQNPQAIVDGSLPSTKKTMIPFIIKILQSNPDVFSDIQSTESTYIQNKTVKQLREIFNQMKHCISIHNQSILNNPPVR